MKTKTLPKKTKLQELKDEFELSQLVLRMELGLSTKARFELILRTGVKFLEVEFPRDSEFEPMYVVHAKSSTFWSWWEFQWQKWENDYVSFLLNNQMKPRMKDFLSDFEQMVLDNTVYNSFINNYLKQYQHGRKTAIQIELSKGSDENKSNLRSCSL